MKVMLFSNVADPATGQTHVHCRRYIHLLKLAGFEIAFVEVRGVAQSGDETIDYRWHPRGYRRFEKVIGTQASYYLRKRALRRLWRSIKPDICHIQWINDQLWDMTRAGLRPLVATAWGSDLNVPAQAPPDDPLRLKIGDALGQLDLLIVDSEDMATTAQRLAGKAIKTTLLPIGIDTGSFRPGLDDQRREWRERLQISRDAMVLISPRQLGANYRPIEIIRAFAALDHSCYKEIFLIIRTFGHKIGVSLSELRALTNELKMTDRVRWVGEIEYDQLPGLYAACDLAVNFPVMDAFPVTFLECYSSGLPVLTNRLKAYESNGFERYLFHPDDDSVSGLRAAMLSALDHITVLKGISQNAREYIIRNYDEKCSARALKSAYEQLLAKSDISLSS